MDGSDGKFEAAGRQARVLFSPHPIREARLRRSLIDFEPTFLRFDTPGLDPDAYDLVVPLSIDWERWLNQPGSEAFRRKAFVPNDKVIALCDDKIAFARFLAGNGLGHHLPATGGNLGYPYVLKQRRDEWGSKTKVIDSPETEAACLAGLEHGGWFRQQFISGVYEYATHMLVADHKIVFACTMEYRFAEDRHVHGHATKPAGRGWVDHSHFYHLFARILGMLDYEGFCCIDYKLERGTPKIFELNPRMGSSLSYVGNAAIQSYRNAWNRRAGTEDVKVLPAQAASGDMQDEARLAVDCGDGDKGAEKRDLRVLFCPNPVWERHFKDHPPGYGVSFGRMDDPGQGPDAHDLIMPLTLEGTRWLNGPEGAALRQKALVPSNEAVAVCDDKLAFARFLEGNGLGAHVPATGEGLSYPYILKPRTGQWGQNTHLIRTAADEVPFQAELTAGTLFRQHYIAGPHEYTTHMLVADGQITFACTVEYSFAGPNHIHRHDTPPAGRRWVDHSHHYGLFARVLGQLDYQGFCCFNYKIDQGRVKIFELNPRPGATLRFVADAAMQSYRNALTRTLRVDEMCPA